MKNLFLTTLLSLVTNLSFSQDVLVLKDGSKIEAKIVEITSTSIKYYKFSQLEGPIRIAEKYEVSEIIYQNGESEKFDVPAPVTLTTQGRSEPVARPPKPIKDPVLGRGFFIEGFIGVTEYTDRSTYNGYDYLSSDYTPYSLTTTRRNNYMTIGVRLGNKWYFGKNEKWRPGFQATWLRFGIHVGDGNTEDLLVGPRTISIANIGMCNIFKFNEKLGLEANFAVGPTLDIDLVNGGFSQGYSFSIESKLRLNRFSLGLDYQYSDLNSGNNQFYGTYRTISLHSLALTVGRKF